MQSDHLPDLPLSTECNTQESSSDLATEKKTAKPKTKRKKNTVSSPAKSTTSVQSNGSSAKIDTLPPSPAKSTSSVQSHGSSASAKTNISSGSSVQIVAVHEGVPDTFNPVDLETRTQMAALHNMMMKRDKEHEYVNIGVPLVGKGKTRPIKGDGNCLFRAVAFYITGHETPHLRIRQLIVQYIRLNQARGTSYVNRTQMAMLGTYATDIEIDACAQVFKCDIYVYHPWGSQGCKWLKFPCYAKDKFSQSIYLDNHTGTGTDGHFNAVKGF